MTPIEKEIEGIVDGILEDYRHGRDIDKLDPFQHPDKAVVIDMIGKLLRIVYPGSSRDKAYRIYNTKHNLSMLIEDVMYNLNKQIAIALRVDRTEREAQETAQELSLQFFRAIPGIRAVAQTDVEAFYDGDPAAFSTDEIIFCYPGLFAITVYRLAHVLYMLKVPMLPRIMTEHAHSVTGIDINPGATIGRYFFIDHGTGIVVGETTVIGDHVKVYQGVTLGARPPGRTEPAGKEASPHHRGQCDHLRRRVYPWRRHGDRPGQRHRLQRLHHPFHPPLHHSERQESGAAVQAPELRRKLRLMHQAGTLLGRAEIM